MGRRLRCEACARPDREFGPLTYQNDNVLPAHLGKERYAKIKLINSDATQLLTLTSLNFMLTRSPTS